MSRKFLNSRPPLKYWREFRPNADYHVFTHAVEGVSPFQTEELRNMWLDTLARRLPWAGATTNGPEIFHDIDITSTGTMGNHPHLTIGQGDDPTAISRYFGNCLRAFALRFNHLTGHRGPVFLRPFDQRWLPDRAALRRAISYVHRNPKRAELISRQTSHAQYVTGDNSGFINVERGLQAFGGSDAYAEYFDRYCRQKDAEESR